KLQPLAPAPVQAAAGIAASYRSSSAASRPCTAQRANISLTTVPWLDGRREQIIDFQSTMYFRIALCV
ncbi:unnamed protein product, partial [Symbiodinium necroappetens]